MVVGSLILIGVSMVASMAYAWGFVSEMTKFVNWDEVSLRRCEMVCAPSGVGRSVGVAVEYSEVMTLMEVR